MKYIGVAAVLGDEANRELIRAHDRLKAAGFMPTGPEAHITLGAYEYAREDELLEWMRAFMSAHPPLDLRFESVGVFSGGSSVFFSPKPTIELLSYHRDFHSKYEECCGDIGRMYNFSSGIWVPHMSIMPGGEAIGRIIEAVMDGFVPFTASIVGLSLYRFFPLTHVETIEYKAG